MRPAARRRSRDRAVSRWMAAPPVGSSLVFTGGWLVAGRMQDHYSARRDYISSLTAADAAHPWIMITGMIALGLGAMALGAALAYLLTDRLGRIGSLGVVLSGVGLVVAGAARQDCSVQLPECAARIDMGAISSYHAVHDIASITTFVIAGLSQLLVSRAVYRREGWQHLRVPSAASGTLILLLFAVMCLGVLPDWTGAIERAIAAVGCLWVSVLAVHLYRLQPGARSGADGIRGGAGRVHTASVWS